MAVASILPPSSTALELACEQALRDEPIEVRIADFANPWRCPEHLLPWLAYEYSVNTWSEDWDAQDKRRVIAESVAVHQRLGTIGGMIRALAAAGYEGCEIFEAGSALRYDGEALYDGAEEYGDSDHWADYRVRVPRPLTIAQVDEVRAILRYIAPARCRLREVFFTETPLTYDGTADYDGTHPYGAG